MSVVQPQTPGQVVAYPDLSLNTYVVQNSLYLQKPEYARAWIQNFPLADRGLELFLAELGSFRAKPFARNAWTLLYRDNQFPNLHVINRTGGAAGATVNYTLTPASHLNNQDTALAFEQYTYRLQSSITNTTVDCFCGSITRTAGAWVLALQPTNLAQSMPAVALNDVLMVVGPIAPEGNTVHNSSGRISDLYGTDHIMQIMPHEGIKITDLAVMSDKSWVDTTTTILGMTQTNNMWSNVEIDNGIKNWNREDMKIRLFASNSMRATDARGRNETEGFWHWVEFNGGNILPAFTGTVTTATVRGWNDTWIDNLEGNSEYAIVGGVEVINAINDFCAGGHINGQHIVLTQSEMFLDFVKFTYGSFTYHFPQKPFSEMNNRFGLGEMGFRRKAMFIPIGKTSTEDSVNQMVPFLEWFYLKNGNPIQNGVEGQIRYTWRGGPAFKPTSFSPDWIDTLDGILEVNKLHYEGSNFKKAQVFGLLQP